MRLLLIVLQYNTGSFDFAWLLDDKIALMFTFPFLYKNRNLWVILSILYFVYIIILWFLLSCYLFMPPSSYCRTNCCIAGLRLFTFNWLRRIEMLLEFLLEAMLQD